ncbi:Carnitine O-palmitoyltransferase 2, mitochondrial [Lamellibrachia satsuma]|nr:Carnitine O-palmitoyltransferase 2, mitochondrial [Lamellibrachia satsuma]
MMFWVIAALWSDMHLKGCMPLVPNSNPFIAFTDDPRPQYNDQLIRATNFVVSSLRFMKTLRANVLEPEVIHLNPEKSDTIKFRKFVRCLPKSVSWHGAYWYQALPLDMSRYSKLFNTTRIPRRGKDYIFTDTSARHLLVIRRGNFYVVDVLDKDGNILPGEEIQAHLKYIMSDRSVQPDHPLGVLTTADRDTWTSLRQQLEDAGNGERLRLIDSALFALALDDTGPKDVRQISKSFLHSDGVNRWFDKSFSLILDKNGKACVNFEHSWGDGAVVLRYFNEIFTDTTTRPRISPNSRPAPVDSASAVQKLEFDLTPGLKEGISNVKEKFSKRTDSILLNYIEYRKFGKNFLKKQRLSPDSMIQLAIQLAFYKQYCKTVATHESASTAAFKHGRTERVRSATMATKTACEMFELAQTKSSPSEIRAALEECSKTHKQLMKKAALGQGFDRHLFVLRCLAEADDHLPELYTDQAYKDINYVILFTSTLTSSAIFNGGFGPFVPNGFGIGYRMADDTMNCTVTGYKGNQNVDQFLECMEAGLDDIHRVLTAV